MTNNHPDLQASSSMSAFHATFFAPLSRSLAVARHRRECTELSDEDWLMYGVRRVMEAHTSGRAFIQHLKAIGDRVLKLSHFFETLKSKRRLDLVAEVAQGISKMPKPAGDELLYQAVELAKFDIYAGDGHYHEAAARDLRIEGTKRACGHVFAINMRTNALIHYALSDQSEKKSEHDIHVLKRMNIDHIRQGAAKGRKVLVVWDRAGIDFRFWYKMKHVSSIYFISREKENMKLGVCGILSFDRSDPRNEGVLSDELVMTSQGVTVRRIRYFCPVRQQAFSFITSEYKVPPGLLVHLYRCRWDIEKVFDGLKNKLQETKSWASSSNAKIMQAHFMCIAHNLVLISERDIEETHGIRNEAEIKRREERAAALSKSMSKMNLRTPLLITALQRLTVRSVKFIRWLRVQLFITPREEPSWDALRLLYAVL